MKGCTCEECRGVCENRPCWPSPRQAERLIIAGYGDRLMLDFWCAEKEGEGDINIIAPAIVGYEGRNAPLWPIGRCTFLTKDGLCEIHNRLLKPIEARLSGCTGTKSFKSLKNLHKFVAMGWKSKRARSIVDRWIVRIQTTGRYIDP